MSTNHLVVLLLRFVILRCGVLKGFSGSGVFLDANVPLADGPGDLPLFAALHSFSLSAAGFKPLFSGVLTPNFHFFSKEVLQLNLDHISDCAHM